MSIINSDVKVAVSSVLNRDVKQYGKKFMFDNNDDTCWNSDQVSFFELTLSAVYCSLLKYFMAVCVCVSVFWY